MYCILGLESAECFLLRELRVDLLPGRSFWLPDSATAMSASPAPVPVPAIATAASIPTAVVNTANTSKGSKKGSKGKPSAPAAVVGLPGPSKVNISAKPEASSSSASVPAPGQTLKKLGIRAERGLVIELLPQPQSLMRPPSGAFRVWVQLLQNPGTMEGAATVAPVWPPLPVLVNGGTAPTLGHLKRAICTHWPDLPSETLSVYKYQPAAIEWTGLVAHGVGLHTLRKKGSIGSKKSVESNIAQSPYFLKEGDQLLVFDAKLTKLGAGVSADVDGFIPIALPEDIKLRQLREIERTERKLKKQYRSSTVFDSPSKSEGNHQKNPTRVRKEVILSLGSGFDFSDEEDD